MSILEIHGLRKSFGDYKVIRDLDLVVEPGARHAIIGPNGAGKTTLFNLITGWTKPNAGSVRVAGLDVASKEPHEITRAGVARSFQRNMLLEGLSVGENLRVAAQAVDPSRWHMLAGTRRFGTVLEKAARAAAQVGLTQLMSQPVKALSYGQKRQLEVGIALCADPDLLLLDEPAAGMSPAERQQLLGLIADLPRKLTVLIVEHDMDVVFATCQTITVLSYGEVLATGNPDEIRAHPAVRAAYLGAH